MCLDRLQKFGIRKDPIQDEYYGWKIFVMNLNGLFSSPYYARLRQYRIGEWYNSKNIWSYGTMEGRYKTGFHCYTNKKMAQIIAKKYIRLHYIVKRVLLRDILATGIEGYEREKSNIVVAKQMYIL